MIKGFYVDCDGDVFHMKNGKITGINGFDYGDEWEEEAIDCEEAWQQYLDSICGVDHGCSDDSDCWELDWSEEAEETEPDDLIRQLVSFHD